MPVNERVRPLPPLEGRGKTRRHPRHLLHRDLHPSEGDEQFGAQPRGRPGTSSSRPEPKVLAKVVQEVLEESRKKHLPSSRKPLGRRWSLLRTHEVLFDKLEKEGGEPGNRNQKWAASKVEQALAESEKPVPQSLERNLAGRVSDNPGWPGAQLQQRVRADAGVRHARGGCSQPPFRSTPAPRSRRFLNAILREKRLVDFESRERERMEVRSSAWRT